MASKPPKLKRDQHPAFGRELRALIGSDERPATTKEKAQAGIIVDEVKELTKLKAAGKQHPKEQRLHGGALNQIRYLELYTNGFSMRVYFCVHDGTLWMLGINADKRAKNLKSGADAALAKRYADVTRGG